MVVIVDIYAPQQQFSFRKACSFYPRWQLWSALETCDLSCKEACTGNLVMLLEVNCFYKLCVIGLFSSFKFAHKL